MFAVKGTFLDTPVLGNLRCRTGYMLIKDGNIQGFFSELHSEYSDIHIDDYTGKMITPGFSDLHLHASQYRYCGTGMDVALLDWLYNYAYPEEARYQDLSYAENAYKIFANDLLHSATTRACMFATIHTDATLSLMRIMEKTGLVSYIGKLNINRNSPDYYRENSVQEGIDETIRWIEESRSCKFKNTFPMITPRFTPSVTDEYMKALGDLAAEYNLPMQSHLSENTDEIKWVKELCPDTDYYAQTYSRYGLFGNECPAVMAHCIYSSAPELDLIKKNGVFISHCPTSNENVIAGIAPAAMYLRNGFKVGLGSDVSGGHTLNMFAVMAAAVQVSKLRWKFIDNSEKPLTLNEAFYMATTGGGEFFGKVGLFEPGYEFDAVVFSDDSAQSPVPFSDSDRLERYAYRGSGIPDAKYVMGTRIL